MNTNTNFLKPNVENILKKEKIGLLDTIILFNHKDKENYNYDLDTIIREKGSEHSKRLYAEMKKMKNI